MLTGDDDASSTLSAVVVVEERDGMEIDEVADTSAKLLLLLSNMLLMDARRAEMERRGR